MCIRKLCRTSPGKRLPSGIRTLGRGGLTSWRDLKSCDCTIARLPDRLLTTRIAIQQATAGQPVGACFNATKKPTILADSSGCRLGGVARSGVLPTGRGPNQGRTDIRTIQPNRCVPWRRDHASRGESAWIVDGRKRFLYPGFQPLHGPHLGWTGTA